MDSAELEAKWQGMFAAADKNGDGFIDIYELRDMMSKDRKVSEKVVCDAFIALTGNPMGEKKVTYEEFKKGMQHMIDFFRKVEELFKVLDKDNSGDIDKEEMRQLFVMCGKEYTEEELNSYFHAADANNDGKITLEELKGVL